MPTARIYRPAKTVMQSGRAKTGRWVLVFAPSDTKRRDPLMGWSGSTDTGAQVRMGFPSRDEAVAYADRHGLAYEVTEPRGRKVRPKNYADNFAADRATNWTH